MNASTTTRRRSTALSPNQTLLASQLRVSSQSCRILARPGCTPSFRPWQKVARPAHSARAVPACVAPPPRLLVLAHLRFHPRRLSRASTNAAVLRCAFCPFFYSTVSGSDFLREFLVARTRGPGSLQLHSRILITPIPRPRYSRSSGSDCLMSPPHAPTAGPNTPPMVGHSAPNADMSHWDQSRPVEPRTGILGNPEQFQLSQKTSFHGRRSKTVIQLIRNANSTIGLGSTEATYGVNIHSSSWWNPFSGHAESSFTPGHYDFKFGRDGNQLPARIGLKTSPKTSDIKVEGLGLGNEERGYAAIIPFSLATQIPHNDRLLLAPDALHKKLYIDGNEFKPFALARTKCFFPECPYFYPERTMRWFWVIVEDAENILENKAFITFPLYKEDGATPVSTADGHTSLQ